MLGIVAFVLFLWLVCAATAYLVCRETRNWSKKKSVLISLVAFPVVLFMADLRDLEMLHRNDWKLKNSSKPAPKRVRYKERVM